MTTQYNDPANGSPSTVGEQFRLDAYDRIALTDAKELEFFSQMSDTINMPKYMGKKMRKYHYLHVLDDANANSEGIDAVGVKLSTTKWYVFSGNRAMHNTNGYATEAAARTAAGVGEAVQLGTGNLYGSSKDVGTLTERFPVIGEKGGDYNGVSTTRVSVESNLEKFGFHDKYTMESTEFDTDSEREKHWRREMVNAASQMSEAMVQVDLLNAATTIRYGGNALSMAQITGEGTVSEITFDDLQRLDMALNEAKAPKGSKILTGTKLVDTRTIPSGRPLYIGTELLPMIYQMTDNFGKPAFISSEFYAAGTTLMRGEIGRIGKFIIIEVPQMLGWEGGGASVGTNGGYRDAHGKYNVYPMLCVNSGSFSTIGFASDGKQSKFKIKHVKPETDISYAKEVFGETGFLSIKWYYGTLILRPEWLGLCLTVAKW